MADGGESGRGGKKAGGSGQSGLLSGLAATSDDAAAMREDSPLVTFDDESSPAPSHHPSYSWKHASMIIVGEVLGTGIMGLPKAMVRSLLHFFRSLSRSRLAGFYLGFVSVLGHF